ncbi:hypothetical protein [Latilactobacillus curvatus]|uniref:hypothetical protein n=1 Tax=Latilactobacillus curvatus TaxID=28038 RepID=UPI0008153219|nr:hypothetical protein [Latilactobacillus curvatus]ANY13990.1 hypothetical protein BCY75_08320 [Latilactobacillus curvatus]MCM0724732.1 hypothetical protein [Latilactobacillus curvatus]MCT3527814.1 hypothetical protein [Latilactobacillus curvatus]MDG2976744.1 hypothetical protein [Latilactobacillus curvatus]MDG2986823.1 hypothetical protein [Latilactobacillus curvatus]
MLIWLSVVIIVALALFLTWLIKRLRRQRATRILQHSSQEIADEIATVAYQKMQASQPEFYAPQAKLVSNLPTEIWGNNVMVFEYQVPIRQTSSALKDVAAAIEEQLNEVAYERRIASVSPRYPALLVTDVWFLEEQLHFDVAFIVNRETIEYVKDMAQVED